MGISLVPFSNILVTFGASPLSTPVFLAVEPLPIVLFIVRPSEVPVTIPFAVLKLPLILRCRWVYLNSFPVLQIILKPALIHS